ncbi:hypothetical protein EVA_05307 [gut metagenome]|uniref:Uncharacterized protein n=1 Tax=gut metagenome TaxID=749906 RepID=J9GGP8_9ZZZZ
MKSAGTLNDGRDRLKITGAETDGPVNRFAFRLRTEAAGIDNRKSNFPFPKIIAEIFAGLGNVAGVVEDVVGNLERVAETKGIAGHGGFLFRRAIGDGGGHAGGGFKKTGGFPFNHLEVALFIHTGVMGIDHLNDLSFAQTIRCVG